MEKISFLNEKIISLLDNLVYERIIEKYNEEYERARQTSKFKKRVEEIKDSPLYKKILEEINRLGDIAIKNAKKYKLLDNICPILANIKFKKNGRHCLVKVTDLEEFLKSLEETNFFCPPDTVDDVLEKINYYKKEIADVDKFVVNPNLIISFEATRKSEALLSSMILTPNGAVFFEDMKNKEVLSIPIYKVNEIADKIADNVIFYTEDLKKWFKKLEEFDK